MRRSVVNFWYTTSLSVRSRQRRKFVQRNCCVRLKQSTQFVVPAIPHPSQANPEVTFNGQWLAEKISYNIDNLIEIRLKARSTVTYNHLANVNAFSALKNVQFRMKLLYKAPTKQQQNILILWGCSSYEKHEKYLTCCSAGYIRWVDLHNIYDKDKELKSNLRKPSKLSYLALHPGNNKQNLPLALETTITPARSYFPN